jgi:hypothetical protein
MNHETCRHFERCDHEPGDDCHESRSVEQNALHDLAVLGAYRALRQLPATTQGRTTLTAPRILPNWAVTLRRVKLHRETGAPL